MRGRSSRVRVKFLSHVKLPRFDLYIDFEWEVRRIKVTQEGFPIAGGFVEADKYEVIRP